MDTFISVATLVVAVIGVGGVLAVLRQVRSLVARVESLERKGIPTLGNTLIKQNRQQHLLTRATVDAVASLAAIPVVGAPTPSTRQSVFTGLLRAARASAHSTFSAAYSKACLRISFSSVFLPSTRCSLAISERAAASYDAGTTASPAGAR